jgi:hypothetical protein
MQSRVWLPGHCSSQKRSRDTWLRGNKALLRHRELDTIIDAGAEMALMCQQDEFHCSEDGGFDSQSPSKVSFSDSDLTTSAVRVARVIEV